MLPGNERCVHSKQKIANVLFQSLWARKYSSKDNNRDFCVNAGMALVLLAWSLSKFRPDSMSYFEMF